MAFNVQAVKYIADTNKNPELRQLVGSLNVLLILTFFPENLQEPGVPGEDKTEDKIDKKMISCVRLYLSYNPL